MTGQPRFGVSGEPPPAGDCERCAESFKGLELKAAGYHKDLKGTDWLKDRKLGKLRVCKLCGRLWVEHFDSREKYTWHADMGLYTTSVLRADSTPARLIQHAGCESTERSRHWISLVLQAWCRRDSSWAKETIHLILACLQQPVDGPGELAVERRHTLLHLAAIAIEHMVGGRRYPPRPGPDAIRAACRNHRGVQGEGLTYFGKNSTLMQSQALIESTPVPIASAPAIATDSIDSLINAAFGAALPGEIHGYSRGQRLAYSYRYLCQIRDDAGRWTRDQAILNMPDAAWRRLDDALDPVRLAAAQVKQLLDVADAESELRRDAILENQDFLVDMIEAGARVPPLVMSQLETMLAQLEHSELHPDRVAYPVLYSLINRFARETERDCGSVSGDCAS